MKVAEILVKALELEGVKYIFGLPGEETLDLLEAIRKSKINFVVCRHEQSAGFMAATYGRLTGQPGVCMTTLGPGATNLITAVAHANMGGMPVIAITGQKAFRDRRQGNFQMIDVVRMMEPITKRSVRITSGKAIPSMFKDAFRLATEERPGVVHFELPEDIAREESQGFFVNSVVDGAPVAGKKGLYKAVKMIRKAERPLLLIGAGANRSRCYQPLRELVERGGFYFVTTQMGKGAVSEKNSWYLGSAALSENDFVHKAFEQADIIINIGHDITEKPPFLMKPDGPKVIHINYFPAEINEIYFPHVEVVGDISETLYYLYRHLSPQERDLTEFLKIKSDQDEHILNNQDEDAYPVRPQKLVSIVRDLMPDDGITCLDNGMFKIWFARNYKCYRPNTLILDNALAVMGAALPAAIVTSILFPERKVIAVCGDGGFMINSQELETAIRLGVNFTLLVLRDDGYGMIRWKQEDMGFKDYGLSYGNPDFIKYAESFGALAYKVKDTGELKDILNETINRKGLFVVEVPVDYTESNRILNQEVQQLVKM